MHRRKISILIALTILLSLLHMNASAAGFKYTFDENLAYSIIKEISNPKYKGRIAGTAEYAKAAEYIQNEFKKMDKVIPFAGNSFIQTYSTSYGYFSSTPKMSLDGKQLELMKDFKPHGNSASGTITTKKIMYVGKGYNDDYTGIDVSGSVVFFDANIKEGKPMGIADRIALAKNKGAVAVLLNPNKYYPMASYGRPISGGSINTLAFYVSTDILDYQKFKLGDVINKSIEMRCEINRQTGNSQNVLGLLKGKDTSRTIVISATLDGLGFIPSSNSYSGKTFNASSMNGSGVAAVLALAAYYNQFYAKPPVNILFAVIGSESVNRDGVRYFLDGYSAYSKSNIIAFYNIYDIGGKSMQARYIAIPPKYTEVISVLRESTSAVKPDTDESVIGNSGNFNNSVAEVHKVPNLFFRASDSDQASSKDTIENIDKKYLNENIRLLYTIIDAHLCRYKIPVSTIKPDKDGYVFVKEINHKMKFVATKYFDIFYEPTYKNIDKLVARVDRIYPFLTWWNYYPVDSNRIKVYLTNTYDDEWATAHRKPEIMWNGQSNKETGGLQSPSNHSVSVCYTKNPDASETYGTILHELNHCLATYKLQELGYPNMYKPEVQEIQGTANCFEDMNSGKKYFQLILSDTFKKPDKVTWDKYTSDLEPGKEMCSTYARTASLIYYIHQVHSPEKAREFVYRMYLENNPPIKKLVEETLGISFDKCIKDYFRWFSSNDPSQPGRGSSSATIPSTGIPVGLDKTNVKSFTYKINGDIVNITLQYEEVPANTKICVFDPPDGNVVKIMEDIELGTGTFQFSIAKSTFDKVNEFTVNVVAGGINKFFYFPKATMHEEKN